MQKLLFFLFCKFMRGSWKIIIHTFSELHTFTNSFQERKTEYLSWCWKTCFLTSTDFKYIFTFYILLPDCYNANQIHFNLTERKEVKNLLVPFFKAHSMSWGELYLLPPPLFLMFFLPQVQLMVLVQPHHLHLPHLRRNMVVRLSMFFKEE